MPRPGRTRWPPRGTRGRGRSTGRGAASSTWVGVPVVGRYVTLHYVRYVMLCYVVPDEAATLLDLAQAARSAGDAVMTRLWGYVKEDGGRIDEQIDKFTGDTCCCRDT